MSRFTHDTDPGHRSGRSQRGRGPLLRSGVLVRGSLEEEEPAVPGEDRLATRLPLSCS